MEKLRQDLERFMSAYETMRKYQKNFFGGNKAALKTAMYWENQTDNYAAQIKADHGIIVPHVKGGSSQQSML